MDIPDHMIAAVLHAPGDLRVEQVPVPTPGEGQVLVRVGACGICGSDVPRVLTKGTYRFPLIPGHEFAGTIARLGPEVEGWHVGERVAAFPLIPCRRCEWCEEEAYEICDDYGYLGSRSNGAFAEYVVAPAWNLARVPKDVPLECAAMTEPAAVALHALNQYVVQEGDLIAIFGAGPIGVMLAQWAESMDAGGVWIVDIQLAKLDVAQRLTSAECLNGAEDDPVAAIRQATGGRGVHLAVEAAGVPQTLRHCLAVAAKLGEVVLLGNPSADVTILQDEVSQVLRKQLAIHGTWNSVFRGRKDDEWSMALQAMDRGDLDLAPLITHRFGIGQANEAFVMLAENREFHNKVLFVFE
jgi:L-iditol 2-dehydrogenase